MRVQPNQNVEAGPGSLPGSGEVLAWLILLWAGATLFLTACLLWLGQPVSRYALWLGLAVALAFVRKLAPDARILLIVMLWLVMACTFGTLALEWMYDFSGDGQEYHLPAILALAQGWNPFHAPRLSEWNPEFETGVTSGIYVQHYAKGAWLLAAATYRGSGLLEGAKLWNLLYLLAVLLLAEAMLSRMGLARIWSWGLALATAANPVSLYQIHSFYVDGQLASLYALVLLLSLDYLRKPSYHTLFFTALSLVLLANIKFTGLVYAVCLTFGLVGGALIWKTRTGLQAYFMMACMAPLFAVTLIGYQPYITNIQQQGHPFYPAVGREDGRTVLWGQAPLQFLSMNRVEKLVRSIGGQASGSSGIPDWKIPFSLKKQEIYALFNSDVRYAGFGPWFSGVLLLSMISLPFTLRGGMAGAMAGVGLLVVMTSLLNPEVWWARLSPQVWLVPPLLILAAVINKATWLRTGASVVLVMLLVNVLLIGGVNWGRAIHKNMIFRSQLALLMAVPGAPAQVKLPLRFRLVTANRLQNLGVSYRLTESLPCPQPLPFSYPETTRSAVCLSSRK